MKTISDYSFPFELYSGFLFKRYTLVSWPFMNAGNVKICFLLFHLSFYLPVNHVNISSRQKMYVRKKNEKLNSSRNDSYLLSIGFIKYTNSAHKKMAEEKLMDYQRFRKGKDNEDSNTVDPAFEHEPKLKTRKPWNVSQC